MSAHDPKVMERAALKSAHPLLSSDQAMALVADQSVTLPPQPNVGVLHQASKCSIVSNKPVDPVAPATKISAVFEAGLTGLSIFSPSLPRV